MRGRTVLITGAAGFIGSHIADRLTERDCSVVGVDNFLTGRHDNFPDESVLVEGDIGDGEWFSDFADRMRPSVIVHCAASYHEEDNWERDLRTNAIGTCHVVRAADEHGSRVVYCQTALCYGHDPGASDMFGAFTPIPLNWPLNPDNSYAISKTAGELYLANSGVDYVSLRLANIYGPRNLSGPIPTFWQRLRADKPCVVVNSRRDYVYIDDFLQVALAAIDGRGHGVYHVASGADYAISDVFDLVANFVGSDHAPERREPSAEDAPSILLDPYRTRADFDGWQVSTRLEDGIASAVAWYEAHGVERTYTHLRLSEAA